MYHTFNFGTTIDVIRVQKGIPSPSLDYTGIRTCRSICQSIPGVQSTSANPAELSWDDHTMVTCEALSSEYFWCPNIFRIY